MRARVVPPGAPLRRGRTTGAPPPTAAEEADWMRRVAAGDRGAPFVALHRRYARRVRGLGMALLGDRGMAEEMVQETFVRLWRAAPAFDPVRGSVAAFVFTVARNAASGVRRRTSSGPLPAPDAAPPDDGAIDRLIAGLAVREALAGLPADHRRVIELCVDDDLTQAQAAAVLGVPVGTVKSRSHHALAALRRALRDGEPDG